MIAAVSFVLITTVCSAESVEIRGNVLDTGENLAIGAGPKNDVLDKKELIYSTRPYSKKFKLISKTDASVFSTYSVIPLFGEKYIAVDDDISKLTNLITEQGGGSEKCPIPAEDKQIRSSSLGFSSIATFSGVLTIFYVLKSRTN
ncbi:MAG: S-layer protein domain-containing protein [Methanohalobium sp.]